MTKKFKKYFAIMMIVILVAYNSVLPVTVYADTASSSATLAPTPTSTPSTPINASNSATLSNSAQATANTGGNSIIATPSADLTATPSANLSATPSATQNTNNPSNSINTGSAVSAVTTQNNVNTNLINSKIVQQTINIFVNQNGDLNISDPFTIATNAVSSHPNDPIVNISFTNINNYAYVANNIVSLANTGGNSITASTSAIINTGNAYSLVSLLNKVNFTIINSEIHIFTINIFGNLNGNIILPDMSSLTNCSGCGINLMASNSANLTNNLNSLSNSGKNSISNATGSASITTGTSGSLVNNYNLINTNVLGVSAKLLYINNFGDWTGNFIGWGNFSPTNGGTSLAFYNASPNTTGSANGCSLCSSSANMYNNAIVINNISSFANSGGNSILGGNGSILTGGAVSIISLINFINSNFINSTGFYGFLNIFGNWTGNIGGAGEFAALNAKNADNSLPNQNQPQSLSTNAPQEQGGQLNVLNSNNVGAFVYPGDTVTFFINVKNPGVGKIYGTKVNLFLIYKGKHVGGTIFDIGDIEAGKAKKLSTGFVLSKKTPGGEYIARAYVTANVGPDNSQISQTADSTFSVFGNSLSTLQIINSKNHINKSAVLGSSNNNAYDKAIITKTAQEMLYFFLLQLVIFAYISIRLVKKREFVFAILTSKTFKEKLYSFKMFLI